MAIALQAVEVILSDGRSGIFTGPVLVRREGEASVVAVRFHVPVVIPSDAVSFGSIAELLADCKCDGGDNGR